jgi:hypothetical protein
LAAAQQASLIRLRGVIIKSMGNAWSMSALQRITDSSQTSRQVRKVPIGDIPLLAYKEEARQLRAYLLSSFAMTASKDWSTN